MEENKTEETEKLTEKELDNLEWAKEFMKRYEKKHKLGKFSPRYLFHLLRSAIRLPKLNWWGLMKEIFYTIGTKTYYIENGEFHLLEIDKLREEVYKFYRDNLWVNFGEINSSCTSCAIKTLPTPSNRLCANDISEISQRNVSEISTIFVRNYTCKLSPYVII